MKRFLMVAAIAAMPVLAGGLGTKTAVVANGQSLSGVVDLPGIRRWCCTCRPGRRRM
jgi:hypothetical protein